MKYWKVIIVSFISGCIGGIFVYKWLPLILKIHLDLGSLADWIMIVTTVGAIIYATNGVKAQIASQESINKENARTFFSLSWKTRTFKGDRIWSHLAGVKDAGAFEDNTEISNAPMFINSGESPALNVTVRFSFADKEDELFSKSYIAPGDEFTILPDLWVRKKTDFVNDLVKLQLFYTTKQGEKNVISWPVSNLGNIRTINYVNPKSEVTDYGFSLKDLKKSTLYSKV